MKKYKLNELYKVSSGISKPSSEFGFGNPFLSFSTVFNNYHIPDVLIDLIITNDVEIENFNIKRGDVFITRTSEKIEELGKSCVALKDYQKASFNGFCKRLRPIIDETIIIPEYAQYLFRSEQFTNQVIYSSPMSTRASLNEDILNSIYLNIHTINEQQHIVDIIGSIDDKIENNNKIIEKIWNYLELFHTCYKNDNDKYNYKITQIAEIKYGKSIPTSNIQKNGKYPVYGSNGIIGFLDNYEYERHKIAISCRGNSSGVIHLTQNNSTITSNSLVLNFFDKKYTYYFYLEFCNKGLYEFKTGSAQPQITIDNLSKLSIDIVEDIYKYNNHVSIFVDYIFNLKNEINSLLELKYLYLKKFFN